MPKKKDLYDILCVKKGTTQEAIKLSFRELAKRYHPDRNPGDKKAEEKFKEAAAAYEVLGDPAKRELYDKTGSTGPQIITTKTSNYHIQRLAFTGEIADIYEVVKEKTGERLALKIARSPRENDLLENEARMLKAVYPTDTSKHKYNLYLPKLFESFKINDGTMRQTNVLEWLADYYPLDAVRDVHKTLQMEHAVWMFNRILEILGYIHGRKKTIHGAILPSHVLVYAGTQEKDPLTHGARLVGWSSSVALGQHIKVVSPQYETFYPPEVWKKKPATPATDIFMAARSIVYVLGGNPLTHEYPTHIPGYFRSFLKGCTLQTQASRPQDAWELHKELKEHMRKHYGPKKYVRFDMPLT